MSKYKVGAYIRLSRDDKYSETDSIDNQKKVIEQYVKEHDEFEIIDYYIDNGFSGANFDRPEFVQLCFDIAKKKINCVIVKDLSRFGRDSGWCKVYLSETFNDYNIRFISINDKLDNYENPNFTDDLKFSLLNLVYEQYAVDISKKVSSIKHMQQEKGDFIGVSAPYGYLKDPKDCHKFIIDKYASNIVRRIFDMTLECKSRNEIADILNKEKILTPSKYKSDVTSVTSKNTIISNKWNSGMISKILKNETYMGTLIQGKFKKQSRKQKRMIKTEKEEWKIVENHHEGIIDKDKFNAVQNIMNFSPIVQEEDELLISRLECAECHSGFYRKKSKGYYYYICKSRYRKLGCNISPIRKDILENMILIDINNKYKMNYKFLTKNIVNQYIGLIEINDKSKIKVVYKN